MQGWRSAAAAAKSPSHASASSAAGALQAPRAVSDATATGANSAKVSETTPRLSSEVAMQEHERWT